MPPLETARPLDPKVLDRVGCAMYKAHGEGHNHVDVSPDDIRLLLCAYAEALAVIANPPIETVLDAWHKTQKSLNPSASDAFQQAGDQIRELRKQLAALTPAAAT